MDENISDSEEIGDNVDVVFEDDENGTHQESNMDGEDGADQSEGQVIEDDSTSALYAHEKDVFCVEASGTRWIGSGGEDDMAHIWDLTASPTDPVLSIQHNDSVVSIAFNSTGTLVATGDMSGRIVITQLSDLSKRSEISDCSDIEWMFWHKSSDILFVGDSDGSAWMWLIAQTGVAQQKVYSSGNVTTSSGFLLPDGRRLLVGYDDGMLKLWQLQNQTNTGITCDSAVLSIAHSETQPLAAVGTANGTVYLLNSTADANLRVLKTFTTSDPPQRQAEDMETEETERSVECLAFCKEHSWIVVGRNDGTTIVYETDTHNTRFTHTNEGNQAVVKCLWIGHLLAVGSVDGTIVIFDARSGNVVKELRCGGDQVLDFSLLQVQPQKLIVACSGGAIRFFDL